MLLIRGPRGSGKTYHALFELVKDPENTIIVAINTVEARRLAQILFTTNVYETEDEARRHVVTADDAIKYPHDLNTNIVVDNVDIILQCLFGKVVMATSGSEKMRIMEINKINNWNKQ